MEITPLSATGSKPFSTVVVVFFFFLAQLDLFIWGFALNQDVNLSCFVTVRKRMGTGEGKAKT